FLARHGGGADRPGEIVDVAGRVLGRHRGHRHYTIGQRRGLGLAAARPRFVIAKDARRNRVMVGDRDELAVGEVTVGPATLYRDGSRVDRVKLRYRSEPVPCKLRDAPAAGPHRSLVVDLHEPMHAAAPGQTACLLEGGRVVGYGTITEQVPE